MHSDDRYLKHKIKTNLVSTDTGSTTANIWITETLMDETTNGGSSFSVKLTGVDTKVTCVTTDLFNGTYVACCQVLEDEVLLQIYHEYAHFSAFDESGR